MFQSGRVQEIDPGVDSGMPFFSPRPLRGTVAAAFAALLVVPHTVLHAQPASPSRSYPQLLSLFTEWRSFEEPPRRDGIPDYTPPTNARRLAALRAMQAKLRAIDTTGWRVPEQVDWHLVRAEMNGMQYHLTVLKPFARDPAYYASVRTEESDTPAEEGPTIHGAVRLWQYPVWPRTVLDQSRALNADESRRLAAQLNTIAPLLRQARVNLAKGNAKDLWVGAANPNDSALKAAIAGAASATESFTGWLRTEAAKKTGPSGIGKAQYTWFLKNVLLVPLSWEEEVTITRRELARAHASLRLEETRNAKLPAMPVAGSAAEFATMQAEALPKYMQFFRDQGIVTVEPWMERALRERFQSYSPEATRNFFSQATHRDPRTLWTHLWHWWDNGRFREHPHTSPIRRTPLLYNVWMSRAEGMATSMEEWMMQAGLYDSSPRSREIVWTMLAARAARGLGNLYAHANELTMADAASMHVSWTPRGWMRRDPLLGFEQHLYLRQPGYGASYVTGGRLMEETIAERARQLGNAFTMQRFFDEVNTVGMIPVSLVYWELTGDARMIRELQPGVGPRPFR